MTDEATSSDLQNTPISTANQNDQSAPFARFEKAEEQHRSLAAGVEAQGLRLAEQFAIGERVPHLLEEAKSTRKEIAALKDVVRNRDRIISALEDRMDIMSTAQHPERIAAAERCLQLERLLSRPSMRSRSGSSWPSIDLV